MTPAFVRGLKIILELPLIAVKNYNNNKNLRRFDQLLSPRMSKTLFKFEWV